MSDTLKSIGLTESAAARTKVWLRKKTHGPVCRREWGVWAWGGCWCEFYSVVRYTKVNRSLRICCRKDKGLVVKKTHGPVCMRERRAWSWGGYWREWYYNVRCTILYKSYRICLPCISMHCHNGNVNPNIWVRWDKDDQDDKQGTKTKKTKNEHFFGFESRGV